MQVNRDLYYKDYHIGILDKFLRMTVYQKDKIRNLFELVSPQHGDRILEVGCSSGGSAFFFAQHGATVTGVDFDIQAIKVANKHRKKSKLYFSKCSFLNAKAEDVISEFSPHKVTMIDFTEHVSDSTLLDILSSLREKSDKTWTLFVYTPNREHWVEFLKRHNIVLKEEKTHTDLRNMEETVQLIRKAEYLVKQTYYRPFHLPVFRLFEYPLSWIPFLGRMFKRRLCITAVPQ